MKSFLHTAFVLVTAFVLLSPVVFARARHEVTFKGTVISTDAKVVKVTVINEKTKKPEAMTFQHDNETKVLRGDTVVTFVQARIQKGEKVAVTVNHDDDPEFALVIRLDEKK